MKTTIKILNELKERGEKFLGIDSDTGVIKTIREGRSQTTYNYWMFINDELVCVECKTIIH